MKQIKASSRKRSKQTDDLLNLRNIGKAMRGDFVLLGINSIAQLAKQDADELYARIQTLTGSRHDPCVWDTYAAVIHQAKTGEALPWWHFTKIRKERQADEIKIRTKTSRLSAIMDADVANVFSSYPATVRAKLMSLRKLILEVATETKGVGTITETLKWGQPSYLTNQTRSGSLIRIDQIKGDAQKYAMYFHCQTTLVEDFRNMFARDFQFGGNRFIIFDVAKPLPVAKLRECIALALTYHLRKKP